MEACAAAPTLDFSALQGTDAAPSPGAAHVLPCAVAHNGAAAAGAYFEPVVRDTGDVVDGARVLEGAFRGRRLLGAKLGLPEGYVGCVLEGREGGGWRSTGATFDAVTTWSHDVAPTSADPFRRAAQWLELAPALAAPLDPSEVDKRVAQVAARV